MKAAVVQTPDSAPEYTDFPDPAPRQGQRVVELVAAGVHQLVLARAAGKHYSSEGVYPLVPGVDAVGRAEDGTLVYTGFSAAPYGTLAELIAAPENAVELPQGADPVQVAAGINPGIASWMPLIARVDETPELGTVLILGATGMAGLLAVQNALALGANRVVAVGRNEAQLAHAAELGAASTVRLSGEAETDSRAIADALGGTSPSTVLDFVWGPPAEAALAVFQGHGLASHGADISFVQIGSLAGATAAVPAQVLRSTNIRLRGSGFGSFSFEEFARQIPRYIERIATGAVRVPYRLFPLAEIGEAWEAAKGGGDRVVVVPR
ncbi:MAG: zinc-binding dehydrogenase [Segniliparus sp.]|uniref:zinc-binding dehydrogenase n=1 Tax=Segniliparus sp. TaxID=2804064 RepID=UPI003F2E5B4B